MFKYSFEARAAGRLGGLRSLGRQSKEYAREIGRCGGRAAAANMTPEQRSERAKKASDAAHGKAARQEQFDEHGALLSPAIDTATKS